MNILVCDEIKSDTEKLTQILDYSYGFTIKEEVFYRTSDALSHIRSGAAVREVAPSRENSRWRNKAYS